jgi:cytochrome c oxidase cbb3-type subunit 3
MRAGDDPRTGVDRKSTIGKPDRPRRRRLAAGAAVALILGLGLVQAVHSASLSAQILRDDPDLAAQEPRLARFAAGVAGPTFAQRCANCHGADMKGDRSRGVPDLTDQDWLYGTGRPVEIERTILYGIRSGQPRAWNLADMPAFGEAAPYRRYKIAPLKPGDIRDVVEYLRLIEHKSADQAAAARGSKVFVDTGQCFDCHANDGAGDAAVGGPNLQDDVWLYGDGSRDSMFKSIAHGHAGVCPAWATRLKAGQIRALAIYISNVAGKSKPGAGQAVVAGRAQGKPS